MTNPLTPSSLRAGLVSFALAATPGLASAATCDVDYVVTPGDTYYSIAAEHYGSRRHWQLVFDANRTASGKPSLFPGNMLYIPCREGQVPSLPLAEITPSEPSLPVTAVEPTVATNTPVTAQPEPSQEPAQEPTVAPAPKPVERVVRNYPANPELTFLTGGDYAPFTGQDLPQEGLVTEIVHAMMEVMPSPLTFSVTWEDDWSKHLFPLLEEKTFDVGFPWLKPDCAATPDNERCKNFHFSDPLMLMPIMLFVREDNQFQFTSDADIVGRSLCRPKGYFTHDLDRSDRRWISEGKITLVQADSPSDCFYKVLIGEVDAATVNLFLGASVILEMGLRNKVVPLEKPVSEEGLHIVISKTHWRGTSHLYRINAGIAALKADGRYQEIVERHLASFQSRLQ